jgi:hypothetical protein
MAKSVKKRVGRPRGRKAPHRPVLSVRVPAEFYAEVTQAAQQSGRTISEEVIARARHSFEWEKTFGDARKLMADARRVMAGELRQAMIGAGYTPVVSSSGVLWAEPGSEVSEVVKRALGDPRGEWR